jgi:hypothetical protein
MQRLHHIVNVNPETAVCKRGMSRSNNSRSIRGALGVILQQMMDTQMLGGIENWRDRMHVCHGAAFAMQIIND